MLQLHPDKNGGQESERLLAVTRAWAVLGSPAARAQYDAELANSELSASQAPDTCHLILLENTLFYNFKATLTVSMI